MIKNDFSCINLYKKVPFLISLHILFLWLLKMERIGINTALWKPGTRGLATGLSLFLSFTLLAGNDLVMRFSLVGLTFEPILFYIYELWKILWSCRGPNLKLRRGESCLYLSFSPPLTALNPNLSYNYRPRIAVH